jgi:hypothetical protein
MNYDTVKERFAHGAPLSFDESFGIARVCADMLAEEQSENRGRDLIIRALEHSELLPLGTSVLWNDLVEAAGLYPYLSAELTPGSSAAVRQEYHRSPALPSYCLHREQLPLSALLEAGISVIVSAPTSFGKSLLIEEVVARRRYDNIVIIQPTLALLDETRKKLQKYRDGYNMVVSTRQQPSSGRNIFLMTAERVVEYAEFPPIDFFVIDEFYKLSLARDDERAITLNQALYRLLKMTSRFYLLGPNIQSISERFLQRYRATWYHSQYATVAVDVDPVYRSKGWGKTDPRRREALCELLATLTEPTIIYCSGPEKATSLAEDFLKFLVRKRWAAQEGTAKESAEIVEWIAENVHSQWSLADMIPHGIAFHHGHLPRHLGSSIVDAFNSLAIRWLFCTSTLIEGVNTTARNVVLFDQKKGLKPIDFFDYKNIVGRSGRMNVHFVGKVYQFHPDPKQIEMDVEVPLFEQANAPLELLVQLDKEDVDPDAVSRLDAFEHLDAELRALIRKNNGLPVEGQVQLVQELNSSVVHYHKYLAWKTFPTYEQLKTTIELCWKFLLKKTDSKAGVRTPAQLAYMTIQYTNGRSLRKLVEANLSSTYWREQEPDSNRRVQRVVLLVLGVLRQWFDFKLPKLLVAISELQAYVFRKHLLEPGNYSYYSSSLENEFLSGSLSVLMDYDVPVSAVRKLERYFSREESWTDVEARLRRLDLSRVGLLPYEIRKLRSVLGQ